MKESRRISKVSKIRYEDFLLMEYVHYDELEGLAKIAERVPAGVA